VLVILPGTLAWATAPETLPSVDENHYISKHSPTPVTSADNDQVLFASGIYQSEYLPEVNIFEEFLLEANSTVAETMVEAIDCSTLSPLV
jgi:hypothetical protein